MEVAQDVTGLTLKRVCKRVAELGLKRRDVELFTDGDRAVIVYDNGQPEPPPPVPPQQVIATMTDEERVAAGLKPLAF